MFILTVLGMHNIPSGNGCSAADARLLILNSHSGCAPRSSSEDAGRKERVMHKSYSLDMFDESPMKWLVPDGQGSPEKNRPQGKT